MKLQTPNALATKNALYPKFVIAGYGANAQASTTSVCTRPPHTQPPGPPPQPWPTTAPPPSVCPGIPPLAATYALTFTVVINGGTPEIRTNDPAAHLFGCQWLDVSYTGASVSISLAPGVSWFINFQVSGAGAQTHKYSGLDPTGSYPDLSVTDDMSNVYEVTNIAVT